MNKYIGIATATILLIGSISIIAILSARGYNPSEKIENGIIEISSNPDNAQVFINNEPKGKTPLRIELKPGKYEIKLQLEKYSEWKRIETIESGIVTSINSNLLLENLDLEQITYQNIITVGFSNDGEFAYFIQKENEKYFLYELKLEKNVFDAPAFQPKKILLLEIDKNCLEKTTRIEVAENRENLIFSCQTETGKDFFLADLKKENKVELINSKLRFDPIDITYSFDSENFLVTTKDFISNFNYSDKKITVLNYPAEEKKWRFSKSGKDFLTVSKKNLLFRVSSNLSQNQILLPEEFVNETIQEIYSFESNPNIVFLSFDNGNSYVYQINKQKAVKISDENTKIVECSKITLSCLMNIKNEYFILEFDETSQQNQIKITALKIPENTKEIFWENQFLIFKTDNEIILTDGENKKSIFKGDLKILKQIKIAKNSNFTILEIKDSSSFSNLFIIRMKS